MTLVEYAVLFSILVLPLTYLPLMLLAGDRKYMGEYANGGSAKSLGLALFRDRHRRRARRRAALPRDLRRAG